jgi:hypothetical protein
LADLSLSGRIPGPAGSINVEALRTLISQQITDVQGFIESSKFEPGAGDPGRIERLVGEAQIVFLILLAVARHETELSVSSPKAPGRMKEDVATSLRALAERVRTGRPVPPDGNIDPLSANERFVSSNTDSRPTGDDAGDGLAALDRELVFAVKRLTSIEADALTAHRETRA